MHNDLDPKKTWRDEVSPTEPDEAQRSLGSRSKRGGRSKAQVEDPEAASAEENAPSKPSDQVDATEEEDDKPQPPQPWPPFDSLTLHHSALTLEQRRREAAGPSLLSLEIPSHHPPTLDLHPPPNDNDNDNRTPTPNSADFREMLESYIPNGPLEEIDRLVEMAERVSGRRVSRALGEQRRVFEASPLLVRSGRGVRETGEEGETGFEQPDAPPPTAVLLPAAYDSDGFPTTSSPVLASASTLGTSSLGSSSSSPTYSDPHLTALNIRITLRLLPAKILLQSVLIPGSHNDDDDAGAAAAAAPFPTYHQARTAANHAYIALSHARSAFASSSSNAENKEEGMALQGRCAYYIGVAEWVLQQHRELLHTGGATQKWETGPALQYFEAAVRAKEGGFKEGWWAEAWVEALRGEWEERRGSRGWLGWLTHGLNPFRQAWSQSLGTAVRRGERKRGGRGERLGFLEDNDFGFEDGGEGKVEEEETMDTPVPVPDEQMDDLLSPERTSTSISSLPRTPPELSGEVATPTTTPDAAAARPRSHNVRPEVVVSPTLGLRSAEQREARRRSEVEQAEGEAGEEEEGRQPNSAA